MAVPVVVLLCGLPGSGKSFLTQKLIDKTPEGIDVIRISLDSVWEDQKVFDRERWKAARLKALQTVETQLISQRSTGSLVIFVDDNMFYRSMRKKYHQLCCQYTAGYVQLHLDTPVDVCFKRNAQRNGLAKIPTEIIHHMNDIFETPEGNTTLTIKHGDDVLVSSIEEVIWTRIRSAQTHHEQPKLDPEPMANVTTERHALDLKLRKEIGHRMRQAKVKGVCGSELKALSDRLNQIKHQLVSEFENLDMSIERWNELTSLEFNG